MAKKVKTSRIRLSQCMIVKNEEANIRRALSWESGFGRGRIFFQGRRAENPCRAGERGSIGQKGQRHPCPLHGDVPLERRGRGVLRRTALPHIPKHEGVALLQSDS